MDIESNDANDCPQAPSQRSRGDRGDTMLMTTVLISFLLVGSWALVSGSEQWGARRDAQAVASAAARAAAQVGDTEVRNGVNIDPRLANARAAAVLSESGYSGSALVNGLTVTVRATGSVSYSFPSPGFPSSMSATASATATPGITGSGT